MSALISAFSRQLSVVSKAIILFLLFTVYCLLLATNVQAEITNDPVNTSKSVQAPGDNTGIQTSPSPSPKPTPKSVTQENYKAPQHSNYTILNLEHSMFCELAGMSPVDECLGITLGKERKIVLYSPGQSGGALAGVTNIFVAMYTNPPTSTVQYLASVGNNFLAKPAYAQVGGSGAGIIEPVRQLWLISRNLAYFIFTFVFIAIGFMIMFRSKINPQTVISAQAALPGLVIGIVLVTFSYFFSALLIDTSFVGVQAVAQIFLATPNVLQVQDLANSSNVFNMFVSTFRIPENIHDVTKGLFGTLSSTVGGERGGAALAIGLPAIIGTIVGTIVFPGAGTLLGLGAGTALGAGAGAAFTGIVGLIVPLILVIALLIQFFRLLWKLIGAYIALLVSTILSPFIILYSSIPGKGGSLNLWWKTILANALVFPAVFAAFLFAGMILQTDSKSWVASPPLFGGLSIELLRLIIAYGLILGTPAIPDMVKNAFGVKDIAGIPQEAMAGLGRGQTVVTAAAPSFGRGAAAAGSRLLEERATAPGAPRWLTSFTNRLGQLSQPPRR
ncbi:MAG: hypothetical protein HYW45_01920 [Candidatus Daviesbacteria bacterium]|nr:MAG: hypothetical protein HYW45_01920 [Candidatus Daviesbacteria bacterium]